MLTVALPAGFLTFLVAIAPPLPESGPRAGAPLLTRADDQPFRYQPDDSTYALDFDPRAVQIDLLEGWDREQEAYADSQSLAFFSGPMYERHVDAGGREITVPLGDLKLGDRIWRGRNRTAARQRAFVGIRRDGGVDFGFGELTANRAQRYDSFIGGLHSVYNDLERPPASYRGAYSISMGQQIRYFLPRIRMVIGLRPDGRLEVLMSRDGLTLEQTRSLARQRGLRARRHDGPVNQRKEHKLVARRIDARRVAGCQRGAVGERHHLRSLRRPFIRKGQHCSAFIAALKKPAGRVCTNYVTTAFCY
jgi:hypothetical protein